ncbi:hypothetical protein [Streptomyces kronopolitis]|uniref:hypothetical protein n=1 Tax=Streptomyces kronopolitis TaxID=1612435 RepID=UPI0036B09978
MTDRQAPGRHTVQAGIASLEGYLLWQGEIDRARAEAEACVEALDWPTAAQREELVALLAGRQLDLSRMVITRIAERSLQLRGEYQQRYSYLKRRLMACSLALAVGLAAVHCLLLAR